MADANIMMQAIQDKMIFLASYAIVCNDMQDANAVTLLVAQSLMKGFT